MLRPTKNADLTPKRAILHVFWTYQGVVTHKLFKEEENTKENYLNELNEVQLVLREKTEFLREDKPWIFQHNCGRFDRYEEVAERLQTFGWEQKHMPEHSPDISPTDYHVFQKLQMGVNTTVSDC